MSQNRQRESLVCTDRIDVCFKVLFVMLSVPWFISVLFFSIFDTKCIIFEQASVINCSQDFFTANPEVWVLSWLLISIISSFLLLFIIRLNQTKINYQIRKARMIYKKGSFGSLIFLLLVSSVYYFIRIFTRSEAISMSISILFFIWAPVTVMVVCCINYCPRVHWQKSRLPRYTLLWWKDSLDRNSNFIIYWLALFLHFIEVACKLASIMLDVVHDVVPLIENKFSKESGQFREVMVIVIGLRLAFHARLLSFFWEKLFHGEDDLIAEPNSKLIEEPSVEENYKDQQAREELVYLNEIICT